MKVSGLKKIQIAGVIIGVTLVVGLLIKFVLPLFAPFLFAFLIALVIDRPVDFMVRKLKWKRMICTIIMLFAVFVGFGVIVFVAGRILIQQLQRFAGHYEEYLSKLTEVARNYCEKLDGLFNLNDGVEPVCLIPLGYRDEKYSGSPNRNVRKGLDEIVTYM